MFSLFLEGASVVDQIQYFEGISYLGIFIAIILSGYIIPLPEDIIMLFVGYLAAIHAVDFGVAVFVAVLAIVFSDFVLYHLSFHGSKLAVFFKKRIKANILSWYMDHMRERTLLVMLVSRFVPGLRIVSPLVAGTIKVKQSKFLLNSIFAACVYASIMIFVGFFFHLEIALLVGAVESTKRVLFVVIIVGIGLLVTAFARRKFFA